MADSQDLDPLFEQIRQGDVAALGEYLEQNRGRLTGFLRTITGDHLLTRIDLDDLAQEVCAAAVTALPTADLKSGDPFGWIQELARRRVVDAHRFYFKAQRRDAGKERSLQGAFSGDSSSGGGLEALLAASMTSPSAAFSNDVRMARMKQAIDGMSEEQQQVVRMRYVEGLPTKQIAEKLGKTDVSVRVLLSRSLKKLEQQLSDVRPRDM
ncbi:RNA polymerase sigma factor [Roseimaritima ulvae]|uniref:ECF RNA polymerase sigma factor SigD n=1 Tax=Roseimaritima ulvae TaxID=980254 RepID=A0A5B9QPZ3_9BACT|nr:sigma-70 family RNA polymerase sigma factor [Roseimaritima ulvae]QEG39585.1 ECF RNA polymerase sigma factor SigD [Roseimaritima ulvae]